MLSVTKRCRLLKFIRKLEKSRMFSVTRQCRTISSAVREALRFSEGQDVHGFIVRQVEEIPELHLAAVRLTHKKTGADYLHLARDDHNNYFSVAFRTTPVDSTGVAHILEHLALCGSHQFPCRDPFFKMLNRSMSTFMNAFTGSDYTMYPFSTQNPKDFENLMSVYLDAAFSPQLRETDFRQEGWRLEHKEVHNKESPIILKGVVYNEMKGAFSNAMELYAEQLQNKLLPSTTYSHVSGGDPLSIPDLTWENLKQFHAVHYHPSNSRFFTYGDFPLEHHLAFIEKKTLSKFTAREMSTEVPDEVRWSNPREAIISCQRDVLAPNPDKQTTASVSYLLNKVTDTEEAFALRILSCLLIDGPNSPFYQALLESGIGADYPPVVGYDGNTKESTFTVGVHGIHQNDVKQVVDRVNQTLDAVIKDGLPEDRIKAVLHRVELSTKHQTSNFGLALNMALNPSWNHGGNPISSLQVNRHVEWFCNQLKANPRYMQDLVVKYFKDNHHQLTLVMNPFDAFEEDKEQMSKKFLEEKLSGLSEADKASIYSSGLLLSEKQSEKEDISCLPTLLIGDVEPHLQVTDIKQLTLDGVPVQLCEQATNGITYFRGFVSTAALPEILKPLLPLFSDVVTRMGAGDWDYKQFDQEADLRTGGMETLVHVAEHCSDADMFEQGILLESYCLDQNTEHMFRLWTDIFNRLRLDDGDRLFQLIKMSAAELTNSLSHQGHAYAMRQAASRLSKPSSMREYWSGITHIKRMKEAAEAPDMAFVLQQLKLIAEVLFKKDNLRCSLNVCPSSVDSSVQQLGYFLNLIPNSPGQKILDGAAAEHNFTSMPYQVHFVLPFAVNYCSTSYLGVPYRHQDFARLRIATKILTHKYLHNEIREKGGAYGGGVTLRQGGNILFYSYRDPNVSRTLDAFRNSVHWLMKGEFSQQDLDEAKLSVFAEVDKPLTPQAKGMSSFLYGITDTMKQQHREQLFACNKDDVIAAATWHLANSKLSGSCLIGPENDFTESSSDWIVQKEQTN